MFKNDEDFFIKIDDVDSKKNDITPSTFSSDNNSEFNDEEIPDYNSPEYAEYISKISNEGLKEIASENSKNINDIKERLSSKKIQLCIFSAMVVLFIAIVIVGSSMLKGATGTKGSAQDIQDFKFLTEVVSVSSNDSLNSYNTLKEIVVNNGSNVEVMGVKQSAEANLKDVNSLSSYINVDNFKDIVLCLENRYENLISLCDSLLSSGRDEYISIYNKYVPTESEIVDNLNKFIVDKATILNIDYKIEDGKIVMNIN